MSTETDQQENLARIQRFLGEIEERAATHIVPFTWGRALFNADFPYYWDLNFVLVEGEPDDLEFDALIAEVNELHGRAGHRHRNVRFTSMTLPRRLERHFSRARWVPERDLIMVYGGGTGQETDTSSVSEVTFEQLEPHIVEGFRRDPSSQSEDVVRELVEGRRTISRIERVRHFAVLVNDYPVSACDLYTDGRTAQVEELNTLEEYSSRGFLRRP